MWGRGLGIVPVVGHLELGGGLRMTMEGVRMRGEEVRRGRHGGTHVVRMPLRGVERRGNTVRV